MALIICSPSKTTNQRFASTSKKRWPPPGRIFPPKEPTPTQARTVQINKRRKESRSIVTAAVDAEAMCFPFAAQAARLLRQTAGRQDEEVALITSAEPARLEARQWLDYNRGAWGIESGLHQRLDVSHHDDCCRIRNDNGMWVLGMLRRLSISLFMEWRSHQRRPDHVTTTDFQAALAEEHHHRALRLVLNQRSTLKGLS